MQVVTCILSKSVSLRRRFEVPSQLAEAYHAVNALLCSLQQPLPALLWSVLRSTLCW